MSKYGEGGYNAQKDDIYYEIERFLQDHPISELLRIVSDVIEE